jgi:hypothetical protein
LLTEGVAFVLACPAADGMLIYKLLGDEAQNSFATSWGVSYGVGAAAEWQARSYFLRPV